MSVTALERESRTTRTSVPVSEIVAGKISSLRYEQLPRDIVELGRQTLLDWLAVVIAGSGEDLSRILADEARDQGGRPAATVLGHGFKTSIQQAALVNGATSHALDYDDTNFVAYGHCGVTIIPGLLALAEDRNASGRDFLTALVVGFETNGAAGSLVGQAHYDRGFHSTATIGSFGSVGACANLLGLDIDQTRNALGIAACQTAGLKSMFGTMCKPFQAGKAAQNGMIAATLAARGFTSCTEALECEQGFATTHSPEYHPDDAIAAAPGGYYLYHNLFKYHAACYITHAPIECALKIRRQGVGPDDIEAVKLTVQSSAKDICNIVTPRTGLEGKFSLRQTIAFAFGDVDTGSLHTFTDAKVSDTRLHDLRRRIDIDFREEWNRAYAEMEVRLKDGRVLRASHDANQPADDYVEQRRRLSAKFMSLVEPVLGRAGAQTLHDLALRVDQLGSMRELTAAAIPAAAKV